ncbi:hypothetical protein FOE78_11875 [Microlunatus elymi]|uniref:Uncharacterized protein n=1 Tax=Microlunatus elymi TaxID=2596828 RepID=A0A516PZA5_9ACTN|nr:hypothetical protein [Microlunatus elymi]QDP96509.1 hypothetical protein FOE78_11875 [Microlunatus elymi]
MAPRDADNSRNIADIDPDLSGELNTDAAAYGRLIAVAASISSEADSTLRSAVDSARTAGLSWEQIGSVLDVSRQAAQQRFGRAAPTPDGQVWRMTPVNAFDEISRLNEAGRFGWHSVAFGTLYHDLVCSDEQWEHRRVSVLAPRNRLEAEGWQKIGTMWFPWAYYARPTGVAAINSDEPPAF